MFGLIHCYLISEFFKKDFSETIEFERICVQVAFSSQLWNDVVIEQNSYKYFVVRISHDTNVRAVNERLNANYYFYNKFKENSQFWIATNISGNNFTLGRE